MGSTVRVRIAPSPTGEPHVGTAYTALFNYCFAKSSDGKFLLRIEDTDQSRCTPDSEQSIFNALRWLGLEWDEGPDRGGPFGPYRQSERLDIYKKHAQELVEKGSAYYCFCTQERIAKMQEKQKAEKKNLGYDGLCRSLDPAEAKKRAQSGQPHVVRLKVAKSNNETTSFFDEIRQKEVTYNNTEIDDQVLLKTDGFPTYHLANVVDDHLMRISHVIRAEEWIPSTPKHVILYKAFGWDLPKFAHLSLLRNADKSKVSKRKNPVSLNWFRAAGYTKEALVNFLGLLGYSSGSASERFTIQDIIKGFSLGRLSTTSPVFDLEKLKTLNEEYIRGYSLDEYIAYMKETLDFAARYLSPIIPEVQKRHKIGLGFNVWTDMFFKTELDYNANDFISKEMNKKQVEDSLAAIAKAIDGADKKTLNAKDLESLVTDLKDKSGLDARSFLMALRVAITGSQTSLPLYESMAIIGKDRCVQRINRRSHICGQYGDSMTEQQAPVQTANFIRDCIKEDLASGRFTSIHTRFPPEPNGYLHIGHAKAICIDFGLAKEFGGKTNLRFDDTNPAKEETEYVDAIMEDIRWLGFDWEDRLFYASDYFGKLYEFAVALIQKGKAYVDDLTADQIREYRGTLTQPGRESPYRNRTIDENMDLFARMRAGEFPDGSKVLRAKIDMASPNINLRDPAMYRIIHKPHHRTGDMWCIYPMYDFAHGQSDSIENITHSLCSLEYEDHRPLYDWFVRELGIYHPRQIEFARLNLTYTVMSKRKLLELVKGGHVKSWDDPRMPTLSGMRRRGYTPEAIRNFCERIGVAKRDSIVDMQLLEFCLREDLNKRAPRAMAVLKPLKVVIDNYPENHVDELDAINNPEDPSAGIRKVPFSRIIYIEQDDFRETPPPKYYRLAPGIEVRLRYAFFITCVGFVKDPKTNEVIEVHCTYDPATRGGDAPDKRKVKSTIHWVSAAHAIDAEVRLYDYLFKVPDPDNAPEGADFKMHLNPGSLETLAGCKLEPGLANAAPASIWQFERLGYFNADPFDSKPGKPVFNRTVTLRDTWAKIEKKSG